MKTDNCNVFHFRLYPARRNPKTLWKLTKNTTAPFWTHSGLFLPILGQTRITLENSLLSFFLFLDLYYCAEFQKKTNGQILRKVGCRHTDRHIYGQVRFHRTSPSRGPKKYHMHQILNSSKVPNIFWLTINLTNPSDEY